MVSQVELAAPDIARVTGRVKLVSGDTVRISLTNSMRITDVLHTDGLKCRLEPRVPGIIQYEVSNFSYAAVVRIKGKETWRIRLGMLNRNRPEGVQKLVDAIKCI